MSEQSLQTLILAAIAIVLLLRVDRELAQIGRIVDERALQAT
jgi:hypothetical protein